MIFYSKFNEVLHPHNNLKSGSMFPVLCLYFVHLQESPKTFIHSSHLYLPSPLPPRPSHSKLCKSLDRFVIFTFNQIKRKTKTQNCDRKFARAKLIKENRTAATVLILRSWIFLISFVKLSVNCDAAFGCHWWHRKSWFAPRT